VTAAALAALAPQAAAAVLHGLRLLPVALFCPFLGGPLVPGVVRAALGFGLGASAWVVGGAGPFAGGAGEFLVAAATELGLGAALALAAVVPFEAARAGGRLTDTLRGATLAELHVAPLRQRESASGDLLVQSLLALASSSGGSRLVVAALLSTFEALPAGAPAAPSALLATGLESGAEILSCALSVGAPAAAGVLGADLALAIAARSSPGLRIASVAQPPRAALGLLALAVASAAIAGRLTSAVALSARLVRASGTGP
jgi:type III secretory pathway component EscT